MNGARWQLLAAAALFSTGGAAIKATTLTGWQVASFRSGVAALVLLLVLPSARRGWSAGAWAVGLAYAATMVLYVSANKLTTAANSIFLQSTAPLYIVLLSPLLLGERPQRRDFGFMAVLAGGLMLFFVGSEVPAASAPDPRLGNTLAAVAGLCWAFTVMGLRRLGTGGRSSSLAPVVAGNAIACLACLPKALPLTDPVASDGVLIVYLGAFQIGLAYVLVTRGIRHVGALEASLLLLLEPALNPIWSWLVHAETPSTWGLAGGAVIIGATGGRACLDVRRRRQERRLGTAPHDHP